MKRGYLALYRKIQDHPFYEEKRVFSKYEAWIDLLMEVRHKLEPENVLIGMKLVECKHGQSVKSLRTWGTRWGWSAKKVSRFLVLLQKMDQICLENVTVTSRITILNYGKYDPKCHAFVTEGKHEGNTKETEGKHDGPTDKKVKNEKNEKNESNITDDFNKFWDLYAKKVDPKKCSAKWSKLKTADKEQIFKTLPAYINSTPDKQYRKNPLTYLNGESWNSEIVSSNNQKPGGMKKNGFSEDYYGESSAGKPNDFY